MVNEIFIGYISKTIFLAGPWQSVFRKAYGLINNVVWFFFPLNGNYIFGINMFRCYSYSILLLMGQGYYIIIMHRYVIEVKIGMGKTVDMLTLLGHAIQLCEMMIVGLIM